MYIVEEQYASMYEAARKLEFFTRKKEKNKLDHCEVSSMIKKNREHLSSSWGYTDDGFQLLDALPTTGTQSILILSNKNIRK